MVFGGDVVGHGYLSKSSSKVKEIDYFYPDCS